MKRKPATTNFNEIVVKLQKNVIESAGIKILLHTLLTTLASSGNDGEICELWAFHICEMNAKTFKLSCKHLHLYEILLMSGILIIFIKKI